MFKTLHNLPEKVIFCKKCVMSNQRPATSPEFSKKFSGDTPTSSFGNDGICDACKYTAYKKSINWDERESYLRNLCDRYRKNDGSYDVIIPGSGGKDSIYVSLILKEEYGMNPLTVTWAPHAYTEIGHNNMEAWKATGLDNMLFTPNPKLHALLTKLAFLNLVNPFQPFIIGQKILAPKIASMFKIPFIMYGENQAEIHNSISETISPLMDPKHFTINNTKDKLFFGGVSKEEIIEKYGYKNGDFAPYIPITKQEFINSKIEVHYMSYYKNWSPQQNYYYVSENSDFEPNPNGRSEGTYSKYASLDDKIDGQHYYTMFIKFGQGRAMNDACRDIRDGYITREEGVKLVKLYDSEFPLEHFEFFLEYINISKEEYWNTINNARSPHLWELRGNEYVLKFQVI